jgi:hypothetical protein
LADLLGLKVDVIVVASSAGALAAKNATKILPVVFVGIGDPVKLGFVASLSRPGGNMTGLSNLLVGDFSGKWVELLKEVVPRVRMALLWNPDTIPAANVKPVQDAAKALRVRLALEVNHGARDYWHRRYGVASGRVWLEYACANDRQPDVQRGTTVHARRGLVAGEHGVLRHAGNGPRIGAALTI